MTLVCAAVGVARRSNPSDAGGGGSGLGRSGRVNRGRVVVDSRSIRDGVHINDFHATILHRLGLDHEKLTYRHAGRDSRLTDVAGNVVRTILA